LGQQVGMRCAVGISQPAAPMLRAPPAATHSRVSCRTCSGVPLSMTATGSALPQTAIRSPEGPRCLAQIHHPVQVDDVGATLRHIVEDARRIAADVQASQRTHLVHGPRRYVVHRQRVTADMPAGET